MERARYCKTNCYPQINVLIRILFCLGQSCSPLIAIVTLLVIFVFISFKTTIRVQVHRFQPRGDSRIERTGGGLIIPFGTSLSVKRQKVHSGSFCTTSYGTEPKKKTVKPRPQNKILVLLRVCFKTFRRALPSFLNGSLRPVFSRQKLDHGYQLICLGPPVKKACILMA